MTTSLPGDATCPGCFKPAGADAPTCRSCGAAVWADGRLLLIGPIEDGRAGMFKGLLRGDDGSLEDVAVKVLDVGGLPNWRDYDRFRRQDEILGSLSHPRIPRARGNFEVGPRVLHCQTLVAGRSLARQLRGARMTPAEVTRLADELLQVLDYLHGRDVVHRDVKPDNVVIAGDGSAHLVDFGAARRLHAAEQQDPEPTVVGTPGYMAPEQTRGEAIPQSDLYALGRLLGEALAGAQPERPLAALLPLLTKEDWHKRPASAAAALKFLHPGAPRSARAVWTVAGGLAIATASIVAALSMQTKRKPADAPAPVAAVEDAGPSGPSLAEQAYALLDEWTAAQNAGDLERYGRCYAPAFSGVRRTPAGTVLKLDRDGWLKDRARIFSAPIRVETADVTTAEHEGKVVISLVQRFRRGNYADHGRKIFTAERIGTALLFTSEEMRDSKRGWDEDEYASQVPLQAADCKVAFDPSGHKYLVTVSEHDDYAEALRAAARSRKAKRPAEIVWGPSYADLGSGFFVVVGALDDEDKAEALAQRVGGQVHEATLEGPEGQGVVHLLARRRLSGIFSYDSSGKMVTVVNGVGYFVAHSEIESFSLTDPELPIIAKIPWTSVTTAKAVRIVEHKGAPHLLDAEGHWYRVGETLERVASFDPDDGIGKIAKFGSFSFENEDEGVTIRGAGDEQHWPLGTRFQAVFKVSDDRLAVLRRDELFLFTVGQAKPRLTKLCITVVPHDDERINAPAAVTVGSMELVTDRAGKLEVWTNQWGFIEPQIASVTDAKPVLDCGKEDEYYLSLGIDMVPMFRQVSVSTEAWAQCDAICGD